MVEFSDGRDFHHRWSKHRPSICNGETNGEFSTAHTKHGIRCTHLRATKGEEHLFPRSAALRTTDPPASRGVSGVRILWPK
jgi:hypothetical protein